MVRLQLLSRNMKQTIVVKDEPYSGYFDGLPQRVVQFQEAPKTEPKSPPELIPDSSDHHHRYIVENSVPSSLPGAGMSSGHNNNSSSSSNQQHYCLRWNNHQHNLLGVLESVLTSQQHADVSLFCEGHVLRVHKLVLLASSSHFERILEATPAGQQPVIILDGTRFADLKALVDYMYRGEVNIEQDQLSSLLRTAENLKIKGLADVATKEEDDRGGGTGGSGSGGGGGGSDPGREGSNSIVPSPPAKRSKSSPIDNGPSSSRDTKDSRDLRELSQAEPRDFSREGSRDLTRDISSHFGLSNNYPSARRPLSPSHSMVSARSLLYSSTLISRQSSKSPVPSISSAPYFSGSLIRSRSPHPQFDPAPGSSLHPSRTSPQSPANDHKIVPQITMPPFGLPFSLPILHDSKKILDRSSHSLLPSHYDPSSRDERDSKEYLPSSWPPRGADLDIEREREMREREKDLIREREKDIIREREKDIIMRDREKDLRERDIENEWERERDRDKNSDLVSDRIPLAHHHQQSPLHQSQSQLSQQHQQLILQQQQLHKKAHEPLPSPLHLSQVLQKPLNNIPRLELIDKESQDNDRRNEDDKFSSSPEKDTSFSPPEDTRSVSSKTDYTPEGDNADEDEDSSGSLRDALIPTGNGDITSTITSTTNSGRPPSGSSTASTPATATGDSVKCPYCPRSYRHQNNLRTHIRCFHKGVRIPCPICRRGFTRWFTVRCHIAREHQNYDFNQPERLPAQLRRALYPPYAE